LNIKTRHQTFRSLISTDNYTLVMTESGTMESLIPKSIQEAQNGQLTAEPSSEPYEFHVRLKLSLECEEKTCLSDVVVRSLVHAMTVTVRVIHPITSTTNKL